ncbi:MAG: peptidylprolyl isomerase [Rhodanobacteraceae bacterium]|nr:peptidylprolyl isomerase [Rhodanobacteraceae bacterium]
MLKGRWIVSTSLLLMLGFALVSCQAPDNPAPTAIATGEDPVIARFNGGEVRRSEIARSLERRVARAGDGLEVRRAQVLALAQRQARTALLYQRALASGMVRRGDVAQRLAARRDLVLARDWLDREVLSQVSVSPAELDVELARREPQATRPETRSFSHIFLRATDPASVQRAARLAEEIRERAESGESFAALAQQHSDSITSRAGGAVRLVRRDALSADLGKLIFELAEGAVSEVITNRDGVHLFHIDAVVPAAPVDVAALRSVVVDQLRRQAREAAVSKVRSAALAEAGIDISALAAGLDTGCGAPDRIVFKLHDQALTCEGWAILRRRWPDLQSTDAVTALTFLVFNRVLAQRELQRPGSGEGRVRKLQMADRNELIAAYRDDLTDAVDVSVSTAELETAYRELQHSAPELREFVADLLFFEQSGDDVAEVYARGEKFAAQLRAGVDFAALQARLKQEPGVRTWSAQGGMTMAELGRDQPPLRDELLRLAPGEVSVPVLIGGNPVRAGAETLISQKGLLFVRKTEERRLSLEAARDYLTRTLVDAKRVAAQKRTYEDLDKQADLAVLLPDG